MGDSAMPLSEWINFSGHVQFPFVPGAALGLDGHAPLVAGLGMRASRRASVAMAANLGHDTVAPHPRLLGHRRSHAYCAFLRAAKSADASPSMASHAHIGKNMGSRPNFSHFVFGDRDSSAQLELTPKMAMMQGAAVASTVENLCDSLSKSTICQFLDITRSAEDEAGGERMSHWCKIVPRGIRMMTAFDLVGIATLALTRGSLCDVPLRAWIVGGMLLGLPTSWLVHKVAKCQPDYQYYRLRVLKSRATSAEDFKLKSIKLYDKMGAVIRAGEAGKAPIEQGKESHFWRIDAGQRTLITGYQLVTHGSANAKHDPAAWRFEGSYDGLSWEILDEENNPSLPLGRGADYERCEELMHLEDSAVVFRLAFGLEVLANIAAFGWLVQGTSWVVAGSDACVDGAPLLFYSCYLTVVIAWSLLGTVTVGLITSAVAMAVLGMRGGSR